MKTTRCVNCRGQGKLIGLGNLEKDCSNCCGVGHVKVEEAKIEEVKAGSLSNTSKKSVSNAVKSASIKNNNFKKR